MWWEYIDSTGSTWHRDPVDSHICLAQEAAQGSLHLGGGDVLALPAERVAAAVTEVHVPQIVHNQHITCGWAGSWR